MAIDKTATNWTTTSSQAQGTEAASTSNGTTQAPSEQADTSRAKDSAETVEAGGIATHDAARARDDKSLVGRYAGYFAEGSKQAWELAARANAIVVEQAPKTKAKPETQTPETAVPKADVGHGASVAGQVVDTLAGLIDDAATAAAKRGGESAAKAGSATRWIGRGKGFLLGAVGHYYGDDPVAQTKVGHAAASGAKSALDMTTGVGMAAAPVSATTRGLNITGWLGSLADGFVDVDNPVKIFTSVMKDANPTAVISGGQAAAVDGGAVLFNAATGNMGAAHRGAEQLQENAIKGDYSPIASVATWATALATGDHETVNKFTDTKAKSGERGFWIAFGNFLADWGDPHADRGSTRPRYSGHDGSVCDGYTNLRASELADVGDPNEGAHVTASDRSKAHRVVSQAAARRLFTPDGVDRRRLLEFLPPVSSSARRAFLAGRGRDIAELREHYRVADGIDAAYRITQGAEVLSEPAPRSSRVQLAPQETPRLDK